MTHRPQSLASYLLAVAMGIAGALALSAWSACEQDDSVCIVSAGGR